MCMLYVGIEALIIDWVLGQGRFDPPTIEGDDVLSARPRCCWKEWDRCQDGDRMLLFRIVCVYMMILMTCPS